MLDHDSVFGNQTISDLVSQAQELSPPLLLGLNGENPDGFVSLEASVFGELTADRVLNGFAVGGLLITECAGVGLAEIGHLALGLFNDENVFIGVGFFYRCNVEPVCLRFWDVAAAVPSRQFAKRHEAG